MKLPDYHWLTTPADSAPYSHLTYPFFHARLMELTADGPLFALGVMLDGLPAGLVLAEFPQHSNHSTDSPSAWIHSVFINTGYRRRGYGRGLLSRMEHRLQRLGCKAVCLEFLSSFNTLPLERILARNSWFTETTGVICFASKARVDTATSPHLLDYLDKLHRNLPDEYEVFPWIKLSTVEREALVDKISQNPAYKRYTPFMDEARVESLNSLGLRHWGIVVGWMVTHRIAPDTIRYSRLFVDPDHHTLKCGVLMLAKSVQIHFDSCGIADNTQATFEYNPNNKAMVNLVERRLKPYLSNIKNACTAVKKLDGLCCTTDN